MFLLLSGFLAAQDTSKITLSEFLDIAEGNWLHTRTKYISGRTIEYKQDKDFVSFSIPNKSTRTVAIVVRPANDHLVMINTSPKSLDDVLRNFRVFEIYGVEILNANATERELKGKNKDGSTIRQYWVKTQE